MSKANRRRQRPGYKPPAARPSGAPATTPPSSTGATSTGATQPAPTTAGAIDETAGTAADAAAEPITLGTTPGSTAAGAAAATGAAAAASTRPATGKPPTGTSTRPTGTSARPARSRAGRRERQRVAYQPSFLERNRTPLVVIAAIVGVALLSVFVFFQASQPAFACSTIFTPAPTASPEGQAAFKAYFDAFPPVANCGPVIARFDQMSSPFQAIVWGRVLPLDTFDQAEITAYYNQWGGKTNLEPLCPTPNSTTNPSATEVPGSFNPSASAAPSDVPSATPSGS